MGIDITLLAERRRPDGTWERIERMVPNPRLADPNWRRMLEQSPDVWASWMTPLVTDSLSDPCARNYVLYSVLSLGSTRQEVVEHGRSPFHVIVQPVVPPRGLPPDASPETRQDFERRGGDASTPGWLLVQELLDYDWDQEVLDWRTFSAGSLTSERVEDLEAQGWEQACVFDNGRGQAAVGYVQREGTGRPARSEAGAFLDIVLPKLVSYGPPDDVRIVFWYH